MLKLDKKIFLLLLLGASINTTKSQDIDALDLVDPSDFDILMESNKSDSKALDFSQLEEVDDLESLKADIGDDGLPIDMSAPSEEKEAVATKPVQTPKALELKSEPTDITIVPDKKIVNDKGAAEIVQNTTVIFDVGQEEKQLAELAKYVETKIPSNEWDEIASGAKLDRYVVQSGDWLWKISKNLFGSGFYYSKIWSLNPHITNPHEIEPGMSLVFDTGDSGQFPNVKVGQFEAAPIYRDRDTVGSLVDFKQFGDETEPPWLRERKKLMEQGLYFQYASHETYEDLAEIGKTALMNEWEKYEPPVADIIIKEPGTEYDSLGFDKSSIISFEVKEGFFLNTFITTNIVQDLGYIEASKSEPVMLRKFDRIYLRFDKSVRVKPGDDFSVYSSEGKTEHRSSDRKGFRYSINAQVKTIRKINDLWEAEITDLSGIVQRKDRLTVYTPRISRISQTFNPRNIEAAIIATYKESGNSISFGDVVYLDRGRADGVEVGNVFETYSFYDMGTGKRITADPTYKVGEVTVISLTDNFSTGLITQSDNVVPLGTLALSKTQEQAARANRVRSGELFSDVKKAESLGLEELDVELNLDDLSKDLLMKADKIQLTDDELEELERQEREKSIIKDHERDLRELDRLESDLVGAERELNEAKVDEDKYLEQQNLEDIERGVGKHDPNAFEGLDDIEKEIGLKFLDEDINAKENPYGLTEFDLEEIDELLNTEVR